MLSLFWEFFKIGLFTFGGGYAMIPLVTETAVNVFNISNETVLNFIAISESTPGPIAINMATFIGYTTYGVLGAIIATLGVILPSFLIILLISTLIKNLLKISYVQAFLSGVRPVVVGLIIGTGIILFIEIIFGIQTIDSTFSFDYKSLMIFSIIASISIMYKVIKKKFISPIILIIISALLGIIIFGVF